MKNQATHISPAEWFELNQVLMELKKVSAPTISVYYTFGKGQESISILQQKKRTPQLEKIEDKIIQRINHLKKNPSSVGKTAKTLCIFGWIKNNKIHVREIGTSKKLPYIYMAGKKPYIKPFSDILKTNHSVMLVILDQKTARIQKIHGSQVVDDASLKIDLQGRHKKGGQSQGRFLRARQTKIHVFFKKIATRLRNMDEDSELLLLGGPGNAKNEFFDEIDSRLREKCRFVNDISFSTGKSAIHEKIIKHLYQYRKNHMQQIIAKYEELVKDGLTAKKNDVIYKALERGAVDTLIVSSEYHTDSQFKKILPMLEMAKNTSAKIEFASAPKIIEKLKIHDSVLAILRYKIK
ncbi:peptide chain release factor 1 [Nitrosopumilus sp. b1]|uniref:baeRF10 domain-containing protein n=1 Tax=Nitrosopumilus sp. b1 TaxID=2109907 RepID=UPI0015F54FA4|nr:Vms1/Ankzf1 family peptidyl-tRNA hydrolase [Nitrosopumilus sp. b1]KAF6242171.1 peptide chain release factor 1 [Nitrosopumilus sp. b1]